MILVTGAKYVKDHQVEVQFNNGEKFVVDLVNCLIGPVFAELKDVNHFSQVHFDPELDTIVWSNGADFAPEFLLELGRKQRQQVGLVSVCPPDNSP